MTSQLTVKSRIGRAENTNFALRRRLLVYQALSVKIIVLDHDLRVKSRPRILRSLLELCLAYFTLAELPRKKVLRRFQYEVV